MNSLETVKLSIPIVVDFIIYSVIMVGIGFYFWRQNKTAEDYFIGNKNMGPTVSALSAGASDMSGWLLMGFPGAVLASGLGQSYIGIGLTIGALLNWLFTAKRLRIYTEVNSNSITIPDYFETRFSDDSHIIRVVCAFVILIFFTVYISSGLVAGGKLFETLFGIKYQDALLTGTFLIVLYTFLGGYKAVCWTDLLQGLLMMGALIVIPLIMFLSVGGFGETVDLVKQAGEESSKDYISMSKGLGTISVISSLAWGLGYFGQPHILVRFLSIDSVKSIKKATAIGIGWMAISLAGSVAMAFIGIAYLKKNNLTINDPERIFVVMSQLLFNPWISGILLSAILAAIMSTASSQLLVSSSTIAEDFYRKIFKKDADPKFVMKFSRASVLIVASVAFFMSTDPNSSILGIVSYAWAGFGASFGSVMIFSLYWKDMTRVGAVFGMIGGAVGVIVWEYLGKQYGGIFSLYSILPAFILASVLIIIGSKLSTVRPGTKQAFENMLKEL